MKITINFNILFMNLTRDISDIKYISQQWSMILNENRIGGSCNSPYEPRNCQSPYRLNSSTGTIPPKGGTPPGGKPPGGIPPGGTLPGGISPPIGATVTSINLPSSLSPVATTDPKIIAKRQYYNIIEYLPTLAAVVNSHYTSPSPPKLNASNVLSEISNALNQDMTNTNLKTWITNNKPKINTAYTATGIGVTAISSKIDDLILSTIQYYISML